VVLGQDLDGSMAEELHRVQSDLFHMGAWLSTTPGNREPATSPGYRSPGQPTAALDRIRLTRWQRRCRLDPCGAQRLQTRGKTRRSARTTRTE
jgi:hypothetical protein